MFMDIYPIGTVAKVTNGSYYTFIIRKIDKKLWLSIQQVAGSPAYSIHTGRAYFLSGWGRDSEGYSLQILNADHTIISDDNYKKLYE